MPSAQDGCIPLHILLGSYSKRDCCFQACSLSFDLCVNRLASLIKLVAVVEVLDGLFKADGDEEANYNRGDMDEEVSPGAGGVVCGVDVEHGGSMSLAF
jgi:hypothetical protein